VAPPQSSSSFSFLISSPEAMKPTCLLDRRFPGSRTVARLQSTGTENENEAEGDDFKDKTNL
jgi:hypothetical protein